MVDEGSGRGEGPFRKFWLERRADVDAVAIAVSREMGCPLHLLLFGVHVNRTYVVEVTGLYERLEHDTNPKRQPRLFRRAVEQVAGEVAKAVLHGLVDKRTGAGAAWRARGTDLARHDVDAAGNWAAAKVRRTLKSDPDRSWTDWGLGAFSFRVGRNEVVNTVTRKGTRPLPVVDYVLDEKPVDVGFDAPGPMSETDHDRTINAAHRVTVDEDASLTEALLDAVLGLHGASLTELVTAALRVEAFDVVRATARVARDVILAVSSAGGDWKPPSITETAGRVGNIVTVVWAIADGLFEEAAVEGKVGAVYRERNLGRRRRTELPHVLDSLAKALEEAGAPESLAQAARVATMTVAEEQDDANCRAREKDADRKYHGRKIAQVTTRVMDAIDQEGLPPDVLDDDDLWAMIIECTSDQLAADQAADCLHPDRSWDPDLVGAWLDKYGSKLLAEVTTAIKAMMGNVEDDQ